MQVINFKDASDSILLGLANTAQQLASTHSLELDPVVLEVTYYTEDDDSSELLVATINYKMRSTQISVNPHGSYDVEFFNYYSLECQYTLSNLSLHQAYMLVFDYLVLSLEYYLNKPLVAYPEFTYAFA